MSSGWSRHIPGLSRPKTAGPKRPTLPPRKPLLPLHPKNPVKVNVSQGIAFTKKFRGGKKTRKTRKLKQNSSRR